MDDKKKYNKALERARVYRDNARAVGDYAAVARYENIFPELRENEDEKIRKEIIEYLTVTRERDLVGHPERQRWITYLEKQKEPHIPWYDYQKSKEAGYTIVPNEEYDQLIKQKEQKPTWNKKDEMYLSQAIEVLEHENYLILANKLKSLRPQPKQEVTDEEIEEMVTKRSRSTGTTKSEMAFYRNGIKDAIKRFGLRPSWKPSEEQMKALDKAIPVCMGVVGRDAVAPLESLYEQLKKL